MPCKNLRSFKAGCNRDEDQEDDSTNIELTRLSKSAAEVSSLPSHSANGTSGRGCGKASLIDLKIVCRDTGWGCTKLIRRGGTASDRTTSVTVCAAVSIVIHATSCVQFSGSQIDDYGQIRTSSREGRHPNLWLDFTMMGTQSVEFQAPAGGEPAICPIRKLVVLKLFLAALANIYMKVSTRMVSLLSITKTLTRSTTYLDAPYPHPTATSALGSTSSGTGPCDTSHR